MRDRYYAIAPNGMRLRCKTASDALRQTSHWYILPAVVEAVVTDLEMMKLFDGSLPEVKGRRFVMQVRP